LRADTVGGVVILNSTPERVKGKKGVAQERVTCEGHWATKTPGGKREKT